MKTTGTPQELASLYRRMAAAMAQLKRLPKRGHNDRFNYDYVTDSDVLDAVRSALGEQGIGFFTDVVDINRDRALTTRSGEMPITELTVDAMFADSETGATVTVTWIGEAMDGQDKGVNKALTAAVKYGLLKTLLASTGEDDPDNTPEPNRGNGHAKADAHWIDSVDRNGKPIRNRWWAKMNDLGLTNEEVHKALGVEHMNEYEGTAKEALAEVESWVAAQAKIQDAVAEVYGDE